MSHGYYPRNRSNRSSESCEEDQEDYNYGAGTVVKKSSSINVDNRRVTAHHHHHHHNHYPSHYSSSTYTTPPVHPPCETDDKLHEHILKGVCCCCFIVFLVIFGLLCFTHYGVHDDDEFSRCGHLGCSNNYHHFGTVDILSGIVGLDNATSSFANGPQHKQSHHMSWDNHYHGSLMKTRDQQANEAVLFSHLDDSPLLGHNMLNARHPSFNDRVFEILNIDGTDLDNTKSMAVMEKGDGGEVWLPPGEYQEPVDTQQSDTKETTPSKTSKTEESEQYSSISDSEGDDETRFAKRSQQVESLHSDRFKCPVGFVDKNLYLTKEDRVIFEQTVNSSALFEHFLVEDQPDCVPNIYYPNPLNIDFIDKQSNPCVNPYQYACGSYLQDERNQGMDVSFYPNMQHNRRVVDYLIESDYSRGSAGSFHRSCLNFKQGFNDRSLRSMFYEAGESQKIIQRITKTIDGLKQSFDRETFSNMLGWLSSVDVYNPIGFKFIINPITPHRSTIPVFFMSGVTHVFHKSSSSSAEEQESYNSLELLMNTDVGARSKLNLEQQYSENRSTRSNQNSAKQQQTYQREKDELHLENIRLWVSQMGADVFSDSYYDRSKTEQTEPPLIKSPLKGASAVDDIAESIYRVEESLFYNVFVSSEQTRKYINMPTFEFLNMIKKNARSVNRRIKNLNKDIFDSEGSVVDLKSFFDGYHSGMTFTDDTNVWMIGDDYFLNLVEFLKLQTQTASDLEDFKRYLVYVFTRTILSVNVKLDDIYTYHGEAETILPWKQGLRLIKDDDLLTHSSDVTEQDESDEMCLFLTKEFLPVIIDEMFFKYIQEYWAYQLGIYGGIDNEDAAKDAQEVVFTQVYTMCDMIKQEMIDTIRESRHLPKSMKDFYTKKLENMHVSVGVPAGWSQYGSSLTNVKDLLFISEGDFIDNLIRIREFHIEKMISDMYFSVPQVLKQPPKIMTVGTMIQEPLYMPNAFYVSSLNSVVIQAGILVPGFYTPLYGSLVMSKLGSIIAHEFSHALDNQGSQFNFEGEFEGDARFETAQEKFYDCMREEFTKPTLESVVNNGTITLGENIADVIGFRTAYKAWRKNALKLSQILYDSLHSIADRQPEHLANPIQEAVAIIREDSKDWLFSRNFSYLVDQEIINGEQHADLIDCDISEETNEEKLLCILKVLQESVPAQIYETILTGSFASSPQMRDIVGSNSQKDIDPLADIVIGRLFHLSYAQQWCNPLEYTDQLYRAQTNVHSLPELRVNQVFKQTGFYDALFFCPSSSSGNQENSVSHPSFSTSTPERICQPLF